MKNIFRKLWGTFKISASICLASFCTSSCADSYVDRSFLSDMKWKEFMSQHDMYWTHLTADPTEPTVDGPLYTGYYAGAIMGNGILGTNLYKLKENVYRLNVGRSDVTEIRKPYNLFNSARLPIGYFTLSTVGQVSQEEMRLSLYDAVTRGSFTTDKGRINFDTYVYALKDYIIFKSETEGDEINYQWNFVPQKAVSPRYIFNQSAPAGYLNHEGNANPPAKHRKIGDIQLVIQPLVTDSCMTTIGKVYVVAWREQKQQNHRLMIATVAQKDSEEEAVRCALATINKGFSETSVHLKQTHTNWWHQFYQHAAFLSFPDTRLESFYWAQYYKFASTTRPGKPIVDLQGVWPTWDTPWTAVWINLNLQLTYSWQTKANLGWLSQSLWESLYAHKENLTRNVTDIPHQSNWTDAACLGRTSSYDFHSPLDPRLVESNQYEVGNLTWLLYYYWQYCNAYGKTEELTTRLFPLLKSAVNLYFHIRTEKDGRYGLPATASPEYMNKYIGTNTNYDLASLRWGLQTLMDIDSQYGLHDPKFPEWKDFLEHLVDYPYDDETGYKVSDLYTFDNVEHRHYSHLFMIYPYYLVNWGQKENRSKIQLSVSRWRGNQGYSRTGKAAMLLSMGKGDEALSEMETFLDRFIKPNTLYAETGPVIETPFAALSTIHDFYMQDWGGVIRIFHGIPTSWKEASFVRMRAMGGFLVSATRKMGKTTYVHVKSEQGNDCVLQTDIPLQNLQITDERGRNVTYDVLDEAEGIIRISTVVDAELEITNRNTPVVKPYALPHPKSEMLYYGDGFHSERIQHLSADK